MALSVGIRINEPLLLIPSSLTEALVGEGEGKGKGKVGCENPEPVVVHVAGPSLFSPPDRAKTTSAGIISVSPLPEPHVGHLSRSPLPSPAMVLPINETSSRSTPVSTPTSVLCAAATSPRLCIMVRLLTLWIKMGMMTTFWSLMTWWTL